MLAYYDSPFETLLEDDLMKLEQDGIINYFPVIKNPDDMWVYGEGEICKNHIEHFMPYSDDEDSLILICGGNQLAKSATEILQQEGFSKERYHIL